MKRSKLERRMNKDILYCFAILIVICTFAAIANNFITQKFNSYITGEGNCRPATNKTAKVCDIELFYPGGYQDAWHSSFVVFW